MFIYFYTSIYSVTSKFMNTGKKRIQAIQDENLPVFFSLIPLPFLQVFVLTGTAIPLVLSLDVYIRMKQ